MSTIDKLNNLPIEKKIKEGFVACSWVSASEIYDMYLASRTISGKTKAEIYVDIAEKTRQSESTVRHYIYKIDNILK